MDREIANGCCFKNPRGGLAQNSPWTAPCRLRRLPSIREKWSHCKERRFARTVGAVNSSRPAIPLLIQEWWLRHQEKDAKPPQRADEMVGIDELFQNAFFRMGSILDHPPLKEASRRFATFS
jgi:hypothetical protein